MGDQTQSSRLPAIGAVIVGGQHPGLGVVRSLGRRGIPTVVIDDRPSIAALSRYAGRSVRVDDLRDEGAAVESVLEVGRRLNLRNWVLFPTRDETVAAFSCHRARLADFFSVTTAEWSAIEWAWDKKKTYELAARLGIPCPVTFNPQTADELPVLYHRLPLAIKPAVKEHFFYATGDKAWRVNTPEELHAAYARALQLIGAKEILVQEIIPGNGEEQYSYCAFFGAGLPRNVLLARRERQHPHEFGRAATYVETVDLPEIEDLAERFLNAIGYRGLVEIEFKRDPRDGQCKLLDVNARIWGFHTLGLAAGVDFPYLQFTDSTGGTLAPHSAAPAVGWLRLLTDLPTVGRDMLGGRLNVGSYLRSLRRTRIESACSLDDPLPGIAEPVLLPWSAVVAYLGTMRRPTVASGSSPINLSASSETAVD